MTPIDENTVVSLIAAIENDGDIVEDYLREAIQLMNESYRFYEVILVDDGSSDDTAAKLSRLLEDLPRVRFMKLSRPFGRDAALSAGIDSALGDVVVTMDPRLDPVDLVPEMVAMAKECGGVVHGIHEDVGARGWLRETVGSIFRNYCKKHLGVNMKRGAFEFRAMSRQAVNALMQVKLQNRYLRALTATLGYEQRELKYHGRLRGGGPRREPLLSEIGKGLDLIAAHTKHPLRLVTWGGLTAAGLSVGYAIYTIIVYLVKSNVAEGWTTMSLTMSGLFFIMFVILTVLSEYVGTILNEIRSRPLYFVAEEKNSSVLLEDTVDSSLVGDSKES